MPITYHRDKTLVFGIYFIITLSSCAPCCKDGYQQPHSCQLLRHSDVTTQLLHHHWVTAYRSVYHNLSQLPFSVLHMPCKKLSARFRWRWRTYYVIHVGCWGLGCITAVHTGVSHSPSCCIYLNTQRMTDRNSSSVCRLSPPPRPFQNSKRYRR